MSGERSRKMFVLTRLHSLAGIVPLGLFLLEHMYSNATALKGAEAYNKQIELLHSIPFLPVAEIALIALPLLYHAGFGIYLGFYAKNNAGVYPHSRNILFMLQRVSGIITLLFVLYHVTFLRFAGLLFGTDVHFGTVQDHLSNPWIAAFYAVGIISTAYHFANGLRSGLITWGITVSPASQRVAVYAFAIVFVGIGATGLAAIAAFL